MYKKMSGLKDTFQAVWPTAKKAITSGQIFKPQCELTEIDKDVFCEYDVEIPMSEGFSITVNVYRSKAAASNDIKVPVIMCAHPYDASLTPALKRTPFGGPPKQYRMIPQGGRPRFSKLTSWESPDPNFWVASGYAVVNMNLPGYGSSGGSPSVFSEHQAKCFYEAIEWVAARDWCTGKVGLSGVSYLAISQFHVAACQAYGGPPPSLCCISPWEGLTDQYQDIMCVGGVEEIGFPSFWWNTEVKSTINTPVEEFIQNEECVPTESLSLHPFYDDYWKAKAPKLEEITVPMLVCGSFADHGLHTMGSFRAFQKAESKYKWIYTHRTGKWVSYYSDDVQNLIRDFMDCFLKDGASKDFLQKPKVRLEVRNKRDEIHEVRYESDWPIARTTYTRHYLDSNLFSLQPVPNTTEEEVIYSGKGGGVSFIHTFSEDTEITGYMKLRLWVEARADQGSVDIPDDMVICTAVNKLNKDGDVEYFYGVAGSKKDRISRGFCRVSRRELNQAESTEWNPVLSGASEQKLIPGQIVPVDIALYPSSTFFETGESIQLVISSDEIIKSAPFKKDLSCNYGQHVIHAGGEYESYLLIPEIPKLEGGEGDLKGDLSLVAASEVETMA
jgi:uncharacterized protein